MWWTQEGKRVLAGAEAAIFREALGDLWDEIESNDQIDDQHYIGVRVFDNLSLGQKLAMLVQVGEGLFDEAVPMAVLTAVNEATVAAVYAQMVINVELEIDDAPTEPAWRQIVVDACLEAQMDDPPPISCDDLAEWEFRIHCLSDRILWDADYEDDQLLDHPPEQRQVLERMMGIHEDYHTAVAPDPGPPQMDQLKQRLRTIVCG